MEKNHLQRLCLMCISLFCLSVWQVLAQEVKWKTVDADLCSFEVPDDWVHEIICEAPGNKFLPPRAGKRYSVRFLQWRNEYTQNAPKDNHFADKQDVIIQVYERLDGEYLPWKEIDQVTNGYTYHQHKPKVTTCFEKEDAACFKMEYKVKELDGRVFSHTSIFYYKEHNHRVFQLELESQTPNFKKIPNLEERFMHIIKSFKVKENNTSE